MAIALICRFYGFNLNDVMSLTITQFGIFMNQMGKIVKMEMGGGASEPRVLTGAAAKKIASRLYGRKK